MKHILTALLAACTLTAAAQTADAPQPIKPGENKCTVEAWETVYFLYEAYADRLVTIDGLYGMTITTTGDKTVPSASNSTTKQSVFAVKDGEDYKLAYFSMSSGEITFTVSVADRPYVTGTSCNEPIAASETPFFVPFYREGSGMFGTAVPIYISYIAPSDGRLEMTFDGAVSAMKYREGCDGETTDITNGDYTDGRWMASIPVEENIEYIISGSSSTAMMATFTTVKPTPGATCADAWTAKRGQNVIPAAAGTYWYAFTTPAAPERGFTMLEAENLGADTRVTVKSACTSSYGEITQNGELALRIPLGANTFRVVCIEKPSATAEDETFTLAFQDYQTYDNAETAEAIEPGTTVTTPAFGGTYYYSVTAPETGSIFLDISAELTEVPAGTSVELYDSPTAYFSVANGTAGLHYAVTPGASYIIKWTCPNTLRALPFKAEFNPVKPGETETNPLEATLGENSVPASAAVYFTYTAAEDSWLVITPSTGVTAPKVARLDESGTKTNVTTYAIDGGAIRFEATKGTRYLFTFSSVGDGASFDLASEAYAIGESSSNPIIATGNTVDLPFKSGKTWIKYTATADGILDLSTTLKYATGNSVYVYLNGVDEGNRMYMSPVSYGSTEYKMLSFDIAAGDEVMVCATVATAQEGATFTFTVREPAEGETPARPIHIDFATNPMDYKFDRTVAYGEDPVWYSIDLQPGIFNLTSDATFSITVYLATDPETAVAQTSGGMWGPSSISNLIVNEPAPYLLKLTSASQAFTATLSTREAAEGETPALAIKIKPTSNPFDYTFATVASGEMPRWYSIRLKRGEFNLVQNETATAALYKEGDYSTPMARLSYNYSSDQYSISALQIEDAGTYYYCVSSAYNDCTATLSGSAIDTSTTGVADIEAADAETDAVYYNLQGVRVEQPAGGLYIKVSGNKIEKVTVK